MKKKQYITPSVDVIILSDNIMAAMSIQNAVGHVQTPVNTNNDDDMMCGAKHSQSWEDFEDDWNNIQDCKDWKQYQLQ